MSMFDDPLPRPSPLPSATPCAGAHAEPGRLHSMFFAILPDPADAERLHAHAASIDRRLNVGGRALEAVRLHVSLHAVGVHAGHRPDAEIARWRRAAAGVHCGPFEVVFDRVATFGGEGRPLVYTCSDDAGLLALHQALGIALADAGERITLRRITPHMTQSYRGRRTAETVIEPVRWRAHELALIESHVGAHRHEVLGRWPLRG
jgi:2'-5' RNA ligase